MRRVLVAVGVSMLVTGCAGVAVTGAATAPGMAKAESIAPTRDELLEFAEHRLSAECMRERGFDVDGPGAPVREPIDDRPEFPYGIDDVDWAAENGFGPGPDDSQASPGLDEDDTTTPADQRALSTALYGDGSAEVSVELPNGYTVSAGPDGCLARAQAEIYGDFRTWFELAVVIRNLSSETHERVVTDPEYLRAVDSWSSCMGDAATPATDPDDLRERFVDRSTSLSGPEADDLAREWAVAEAECTTEIGLADVGRRLENRYQEEVRATHHAEIEQLTAIKAEAVIRARTLGGT